MNWSIADDYFGKAYDYYPDVENVSENLKYALSYEPEHALANWLFAKLQMEAFEAYEEAEYYFEVAIASDPKNLKALKDFVWLKIRTDRYDEAFKLLKYIQKLPGSGKGETLRMKALVLELMEEYEKARELIKAAIDCSYDDQFISFLNSELKRVNQKYSRANKETKVKKEKVLKKQSLKSAKKKEKTSKLTFREKMAKFFARML